MRIRHQSFVIGVVFLIKYGSSWISNTDNVHKRRIIVAPFATLPETSPSTRGYNVTQAYLDDLRRVRKPLLHIDAFERRNKPKVLTDDPDRVERVLKMVQQWQTLHGNVPDTAYELVLEGLAERGRLRWYDSTRDAMVCSADLAEEVMLNVQNPSDRLYELLLRCYAHCSSPRANRTYAELGHALLQSQIAQPTPNMILHVLHAYCWQQSNRCPGTLARVAQQLYDDHLRDENVGRDIQVSAQIHLLEAFSKALDSAHVCDTILETLKEWGATDAECYTNVILAWSKQAQNEQCAPAAQRAHELLLELLNTHEPKLIAFNAVIGAWGRVERPDQTKDVMLLMEQTRQRFPSLQPDTVFYNSVLHGMLKHPDKEIALEDVLDLYDRIEKPDAFSLHTIMKAYKQARPQNDFYVNELIGLLDQLEMQWFENFDKSTEPHNRVYNLVLDSYAKLGDAQPALELLEHMKGLPNSNCHPDRVSYTSVLECLAKSRVPDAADVALKLLDEVKDQYAATKRENVMPNLRTYTMVIQTLANSQGNVERAYELLLELEELYETTKHPSFEPNTYPYNYVLLCAANDMTNKLKAFKIATETYKRLGESRDSFSYAFWLKCGNNLLEPELRAKVTRQAFAEAKSRGLVSNPLLHRVIQGNSPVLVQELLEGVSPTQASVSVKNLPRKWSCNV